MAATASHSTPLRGALTAAHAMPARVSARHLPLMRALSCCIAGRGRGLERAFPN